MKQQGNDTEEVFDWERRKCIKLSRLVLMTLQSVSRLFKYRKGGTFLPVVPRICLNGGSQAGIMPAKQITYMQTHTKNKRHHAFS